MGQRFFSPRRPQHQEALGKGWGLPPLFQGESLESPKLVWTIPRLAAWECPLGLSNTRDSPWPKDDHQGKCIHVFLLFKQEMINETSILYAASLALRPAPPSHSASIQLCEALYRLGKYIVSNQKLILKFWFPIYSTDNLMDFAQFYTIYCQR